jgi:adenylate kinase family enzyme
MSAPARAPHGEGAQPANAGETDPGDVDSPAEARDALSPLPGDVERPRRLIILMGGPGSGKGTIGSMLVEELRGEGWQCAHVSVGTLLRAAVARHRHQPLRQSARNFFRGDAASIPTIASREKGPRGGKMLRRAPSLAAKQLGAVAKHLEDQVDGGQEDGGVSVAGEVAAAMAAGRPVGSELVLRVILDGIREYGPHQTLLLDGFPLNLAQAGLMEAASELGMPDGVILLRCPENCMIQVN